MCNAACDLPAALQPDLDPLAPPAPSRLDAESLDTWRRALSFGADVIRKEGLEDGMAALMATIVIIAIKPSGAPVLHAKRVTNALLTVLKEEVRRLIAIRAVVPGRRPSVKLDAR